MTVEDQATANLAIANTHLFFIRKMLELGSLRKWAEQAPALQQIADRARSQPQRRLECEALAYARLVAAYQAVDRKTLSEAAILDKAQFPWAIDIARDLASTLPITTFNVLDAVGTSIEIRSPKSPSRVFESPAP